MDSTLKPFEEREEVILNGKKVNQEQLQESIETANQMKGVKVVEVGPGEFKTRIQG